MQKSMGLKMRRGLLIGLSSFVLSCALPTTQAVPVAGAGPVPGAGSGPGPVGAGPAATSTYPSYSAYPSSLLPGFAQHGAKKAVTDEAPLIPFAQRYRDVVRGGIVRAANSSITCRTPCPAVQGGAAGANGDHDMFYIDVDRDPNTYNSSRAEVRLPKGARVAYARLYWGGNLLVGEQKPAKDNGRVLIAEQGGEYKEVLADTVIGHRVADGADAYQASADVTSLVRESGSGLYTVAQLNVAMGKSKAGAWGGWSLVVAYQDDTAPRRVLTLWDGFQPVRKGADPVSVRLDGMALPKDAKGLAGFVAYDGGRGVTGDYVNVFANSAAPHSLSDAANPKDDVMNSSVTDFGIPGGERVPAYANTLGYDSDVFDLAPALRVGGTELTFRFGTAGDGYLLGALFTQTDVRR